MSTVYAKFGLLPLCLVAACATSSHVDLTTGAPTARPTDAAEAFIAAWNGGERATVLATFEPKRRAVISQSAELDRRLGAWSAVAVAVPEQCNPRGAFWKTATVTFRPRDAASGSVSEIVWLHRATNGWWMYAL